MGIFLNISKKSYFSFKLHRVGLLYSNSKIFSTFIKLLLNKDSFNIPSLLFSLSLLLDLRCINYYIEFSILSCFIFHY